MRRTSEVELQRKVAETSKYAEISGLTFGANVTFRQNAPNFGGHFSAQSSGNLKMRRTSEVELQRKLTETSKCAELPGLTFGANVTFRQNAPKSGGHFSAQSSGNPKMRRTSEVELQRKLTETSKCAELPGLTFGELLFSANIAKGKYKKNGEFAIFSKFAVCVRTYLSPKSCQIKYQALM